MIDFKKIKKKPFIYLLFPVLFIFSYLAYYFNNIGYGDVFPPELYFKGAKHVGRIYSEYNKLKKTRFSNGKKIEIIGWKKDVFDFNTIYSGDSFVKKTEYEYYFRFRYQGRRYTIYFYPNHWGGGNSNEFVAVFYEFSMSQKISDDPLEMLLKEIHTESVFLSKLPEEVKQAKLSRTNILVNEVISQFDFLKNAEWTSDYGQYKIPFNLYGKESYLRLLPIKDEWHLQLELIPTYGRKLEYIYYPEFMDRMMNKNLDKHYIFSDRDIKNKE